MTTKPGDSRRLTLWILGGIVGLCLCSCGRRFIPEEAAETPPAGQAAITERATSPATQTAQPIPVQAIAAQAIALATEVARPIATPDERVLNPENQHLYLFIWNPDSWHGARDTCASRGGYLVTIESASENGFVHQLAGCTWLGATDEIQEGAWAWVTGESWDYTNWIEGEPNNCCGPESCGGTDCSPEHYLCLEIEGIWNDRPRQSANGFVCEWEPVSP